MPVRLGVPQHVAGLVDVVRNPIYSTGVGLLLYGLRHGNERRGDVRLNAGARGIWERMKGWFQI